MDSAELNVDERDLFERLAQVAHLLDTGSVHETLQRIVDLAVEVVPGCEHAGISIVHKRKIATPAASDAVALRIDATQVETKEGPCLDAIAKDRVFKTDDLAHEARWPHFAAKAVADAGVSSIAGFRLFARGRTLGALNLFSGRRAAFNDDTLAIGALFAALASVALSAAEKEEGLQVALKTRDVIGQAMGILMERHKVTGPEAFEQLHHASQHLNVRLADIAERIVRTGQEPDDHTPN